jgi:hypothetical protein
MESVLYTRTEYTLTSLRRKGKGREASGKRKIASFPHLTPVVERSQYQGLLPSSRFSKREEERKKRIEASSQNGSAGLPSKVKDPLQPNIHVGGQPRRDHFQQFKQHRDSRELSRWINLEAKANPWSLKTG